MARHPALAIRRAAAADLVPAIKAREARLLAVRSAGAAAGALKHLAVRRTAVDADLRVAALGGLHLRADRLGHGAVIGQVESGVVDLQ